MLTAAEAVIDEDGLDRFTMSRVVERAGVSVGSLYQYFPSKESILAELARRLERRTHHRIIEILEGSIRDFIARIAHRRTVYEQWGFESKIALQYRELGKLSTDGRIE